MQMVPEPQLLDSNQNEQLFDLLTDHHVLDEKERGETT